MIRPNYLSEEQPFIRALPVIITRLRSHKHSQHLDARSPTRVYRIADIALVRISLRTDGKLRVQRPCEGEKQACVGVL